MQEFVRQAFLGRKPELIDKLEGAALAEIGLPKAVDYEEAAEGEYNAIALPEVPWSVVSVEDAEGEPGYGVVGQQVIADRPLAPPVMVSYVTPAERARWEAAVLDAIRKELAKA